ncbi:MAG: hypothetical protein GX878_01960 [Firmicutes bacterium]|nr:hypothetical protein [Bacillota bacterium]
MADRSSLLEYGILIHNRVCSKIIVIIVMGYPSDPADMESGQELIFKGASLWLRWMATAGIIGCFYFA